MKLFQDILFLLLLVVTTPIMLLFAWITSLTEKANRNRSQQKKLKVGKRE
jgi:hypothetical protein